MMFCTWEKTPDGTRCHCPTCDPNAARPVRCGVKRPCGGKLSLHPDNGISAPAAPRPAGGPGTELKKLLGRWHITESAGCGCSSYAAKMDRWGVAGCRQRRDEILDHLVAEAEKRKLLGLMPCKRRAAGILLDRAIKNAERRSSNSDLLIRRPLGARLKIAFGLPALAVGGVEEWLLGLIETLPADCEVVGVGVTKPTYTHAAAVAAMRARVPVYIGDDCAKAWESSDVLIVWHTPSVAPFVEGYRGRIVCTVHESTGEHVAEYTRAARSLGAPLVAVSEAAAAACRLPGVHTIPNGIRLDRLKTSLSTPAARARLGLPRASFVCGYVGRLATEKRLHLAVEALQSLPTDFHVALVGQVAGDRGPSLAEFAARRGVGERLHVLPSTPHIGDVILALDCFLGLSREEGFWLAGLEAAGAGVPLVTTRAGVLETIAARHAVLWTELARDPSGEEVAAAVLSAAADRGAAEDQAAALRQIVAEEYSAERSGRLWGEYLWEVCSR